MSQKYPELVEIRVFGFDNQNLEDERTFPVLVLENAILTTEDAFTLDSNERYRAKIFVIALQQVLTSPDQLTLVSAYM